MTTETRGQNSWVNYGPHGENNRHAKEGGTVFAPQKIGLLPEWVWKEGRKDPVKKKVELSSFGQLIELLQKFDPDEPRDDHGRWTTGGGDGNRGKDTKREWINTNPNNTLESAMAAAQVNQNKLHEVGSKIAEQLGIKWKNPGTKSNESGRVDEEAASRGGYNHVTDLSRATFVVKTPEQAYKAIRKVRAAFDAVDEGWQKTPVGYMDRKLLVRFDNGGIGEIQIMNPEMEYTKSDTGAGGHGLYVKWRSLPLDDPRRGILASSRRTSTARRFSARAGPGKQLPGERSGGQRQPRRRTCRVPHRCCQRQRNRPVSTRHR